MDRIDIHVDVPEVKFDEIRGRGNPKIESSKKIRERVAEARRIQLKRFDGSGVYSNSGMTPKQIRENCTLDEKSESLLERAMTGQGLSARAHDRILKVARTIADMDASGEIRKEHLSEAINYRSLDRHF